MSHAIAGGAIAFDQIAHLAGGFGECDFIAIAMIRTMRADRHGEKRPRAIRRGGAQERIADRRIIKKRATAGRQHGQPPILSWIHSCGRLPSNENQDYVARRRSAREDAMSELVRLAVNSGIDRKSVV